MHGSEGTEEDSVKKARADISSVKDCGACPESEISIIKTLSEYTGSGVAFCEENSQFCLPGGELSNFELLQVIDFEHKILCCFDRINYEIQMGLREGYPKAE